MQRVGVGTTGRGSRGERGHDIAQRVCTVAHVLGHPLLHATPVEVTAALLDRRLEVGTGLTRGGRELGGAPADLARRARQSRHHRILGDPRVEDSLVQGEAAARDLRDPSAGGSHEGEEVFVGAVADIGRLTVEHRCRGLEALRHVGQGLTGTRSGFVERLRRADRPALRQLLQVGTGRGDGTRAQRSPSSASSPIQANTGSVALTTTTASSAPAWVSRSCSTASGSAY